MAKKIINFGKIDFFETGRKINSVDIEIELRDTETGPEFTVCGTVWNSKHTNCVQAGQCLDHLLPFFKNNKQFVEIHRLWKRWHLNTLKAGDKEQEEAVKTYLKTHDYDYTEVCKYLDTLGLLVHNGYKYGTAWLTEQISAEDLEKIYKLLED